MILIDNGHSRQTPGKCSPLFDDGVTRFYEWEWNRKVARELHKRLCAEGICNVLLVPEDDYDVPLMERANRANKYGKDGNLFISIHFNAAGDGKTWNTARGWSIYTSKGSTRSDKIATVFWNTAKEEFPKDITLRKDMSDGDPDWEENFTVLTKTKCPAILTENLFMTNKEDVKYIMSEEGFNAIVNLHLKAIKKCIEEGLI